MTSVSGYPPAILEAEHIVAVSLRIDPDTASRDELVASFLQLQRAAGLALDAYAAVSPDASASPSASERPSASADAPVHPATSPSASGDASERLGASGSASDEELLERARRVDAEHRAAHGRPASLRKLQSKLRIGQPRAQELQRALTASAALAETTTPTRG